MSASSFKRNPLICQADQLGVHNDVTDNVQEKVYLFTCWPRQRAHDFGWNRHLAV